MMDKREYRLQRTNNIKSTDSDGYIQLNLEQKSKILPNDVVIKEFDIKSQYDKDRLKINSFRFTIEIDPIVTNSLLNLTGKDALCVFNEFRFTERSMSLNSVPYNNFSDSVNGNLVKINGINGFYEPYKNAFDIDKTFVELEPKMSRFQIAKYKKWVLGKNFTDEYLVNENWFIELFYPYKNIKDHYLINDSSVGNGIIITKFEDVIINNSNYIKITSPIKHNLSLDTNTKVSIFDKKKRMVFSIFGLGDENGLNSEYIFMIPGKFLDFNFSRSSSRFCKNYRSKDSKYYIRSFKKIGNNVNVSDLAFNLGCFSDQNVQAIPQEKLNLDLNNLLDNLNRPITEVYCYIQKKTDNNFFLNPMSGFDLNQSLPEYYLTNESLNFSDIRKIHSRVNSNPKPHNKLEELTKDSINSDVMGDICEWNDLECTEYVICDVLHRFNTINREYTADNLEYIQMKSNLYFNGSYIERDVILNYDYLLDGSGFGGETNGFTYINGSPINPPYGDIVETDYYHQSGDYIGKVQLDYGPGAGARLEGYMYKPLHKIKIKEFSDDISESYTGTTTGYTYETPPGYAVEVGGGRFVWREILKPTEDTLNLPMANKCFYVNNKIKFEIKRQDPFNKYGLYHYESFGNIIAESDYNSIPKNNNSQKC